MPGIFCIFAIDSTLWCCQENKKLSELLIEAEKEKVVYLERLAKLWRSDRICYQKELF